MAVTSKWYLQGLKAVMSGSINWTSDTIKVSLHTASYTPDQDAHDFYNDLTNELPTANGYTAGGATLGTKSVVATDATNIVSLRAADTAWTPAAGETLTARYAVIRKDTGTASTSALLGYVDYGENISATGAPLTVNWDDTEGVLKNTAA